MRGLGEASTFTPAPLPKEITILDWNGGEGGSHTVVQPDSAYTNRNLTPGIYRAICCFCHLEDGKAAENYAVPLEFVI